MCVIAPEKDVTFAVEVVKAPIVGTHAIPTIDHQRDAKDVRGSALIFLTPLFLQFGAI